MESNISTIISEDLITYSLTNSPRNSVLLDLYTSTVLSLLTLTRHFGKDIIAQRLAWSKDDPRVEFLLDRVYQVLLLSVMD